MRDLDENACEVVAHVQVVGVEQYGTLNPLLHAFVFCKHGERNYDLVTSRTKVAGSIEHLHFCLPAQYGCSTSTPQ